MRRFVASKAMTLRRRCTLWTDTNAAAVRFAPVDRGSVSAERFSTGRTIHIQDIHGRAQR